VKQEPWALEDLVFVWDSCARFHGIFPPMEKNDEPK
jgi:hypothetical protein